MRAASGVSSSLALMSRTALDTVLPPQCLACDALVATPGSLCPDYWDDAVFVSAPFCSACGVPFEFEQGPAALCGACIRERPVFSRARAVFIYNDVSRDLVTGLKHRDRMHGAPAFGRWLARAGRELVEDADLVVPVPLHRLRLLPRETARRGLVAPSVDPHSGWVERFPAPPQCAGAFVATPRYTDDLAGQHVLLIDDVYTTGATLEACTKVLLGAGATQVDVLVLARVDRPR